VELASIPVTVDSDSAVVAQGVDGDGPGGSFGGDSEALEVPSSRRSGVGVSVAGVVVVVLLALVGIGFIWFGPTGGEVASRGSKALASAVEPDAEGSSGVEGPGALEAGAGVDADVVGGEDPEVIWTLSSQPQGATVHRSGKVLCLATPCKASFERLGEAVELTFELSGYAHETASFSPEQGGQLVVPLRRRASVGGGGVSPVRKNGNGSDLFNVPHH